MTGDEELNELLDELDRQAAAENPDRAVEQRARAWKKPWPGSSSRPRRRPRWPTSSGSSAT